MFIDGAETFIPWRAQAVPMITNHLAAISKFGSPSLKDISYMVNLNLRHLQTKEAQLTRNRRAAAFALLRGDGYSGTEFSGSHLSRFRMQPLRRCGAGCWVLRLTDLWPWALRKGMLLDACMGDRIQSGGDCVYLCSGCRPRQSSSLQAEHQIRKGRTLQCKPPKR